MQRRNRQIWAISARRFPPWVHWGWQLQNSYSFSSSVCTWDSHSPTSPSTKKHRFQHTISEIKKCLFVHWPYFRWKFSAFPWTLCRTRQWNRASPWSHNPTRGTVTHRQRSLRVTIFMRYSCIVFTPQILCYFCSGLWDASLLALFTV